MTHTFTLLKDLLNEFERGQISLTSFVNRALRISYLMKDWEMILYLHLNQHDSDNEIENNVIKTEIAPRIIKEIGKEQYEKMFQRVIQKYFSIRRLGERKDEKGNEICYGRSVSNLEEYLQFLNRQRDKNTVTNGLHPIDQFYAEKNRRDIEITIEQQIIDLKAVANRIGNDIYQYFVSKSDLYAEGNESMTISNITKNVFIIHGHDEAKVRELKDLIIRDFKLNPIILSEQPDKGRTLIEKFEHYAKDCVYAFAIFTPDDIIDHGTSRYFQARPNVIFELGWFYSNIGRSRVCILLKEDPKMDVFSDLQGVIQKRFYKNISEIFREISLELKEIDLI